MNLRRVKIASLPTDLYRMNRLSDYLGLDVYIKRDDNTGLALGGNKARKLEFLLGEALDKGSKSVITTGAVQSNHARQTAAACALSGLECHLVLEGGKSVPNQGNLLLDRLLGAEVHIVKDEDEANMYINALQAKLAAEGKNPYVIPVGGSTPVGAAGYFAAMMELFSQSREHGISFDKIIFASGSGGTHAGLLAGALCLGVAPSLLGVSVSRAAALLRRQTVDLANALLSRVGFPALATPSDVNVTDQFIGPGYGVPSDEAKEAIRLFAHLEGVLLDPVYTAKAAAALLHMAKEGTIQGNILFWHTGGSPVLFAMGDQII